MLNCRLIVSRLFSKGAMIMNDKILKDAAVNVLNEKLISCSDDPLTGFFRDGYCNTCKEDLGSHTICVKVTETFLDYSKLKGNDLSTPMPEYAFKGLQAGDCWCLCAKRWLQAHKDGMAPRVYLQRTHIKALQVVSLKLLSQYAIDLN